MDLEQTEQRPFESFPNFTNSMYKGNKPAGVGYKLANGDYCDRWVTEYGEGQSYKDRIVCANFSLNAKVTIYIMYDALWVVDRRHSGKSDFWEYCVNCSGTPGSPCFSECHRHKLEPERLERYLRTVILNCKFWDMVQERALELSGLDKES